MRRDFFSFCFISALVWLLLYVGYVAFPYVRNGAEVIGTAKVAYLESHPLFSPNVRARILVFGNSKVLAAFNPAVYDPAVSPGADSFNAGRPGDASFVSFLRRILAGGAKPTHILVQTPPNDEREITWRDFFEHDNLVVNLLFPFRTFPRDLTLFMASARHEGGVINSYRENALTVDRVIADKGYYFIKGQSHFPNDRLPDDYRLPTDTPTTPPRRVIDPEAPAFRELASLAAAYGFKVIFIPTPFRVGQYAPPEPAPFDTEPRPLPSTPGFYVAGSAAWLFEPRYFSDPTHLNKEGAAIYSRRLAELTAPIVNGGD